MIEMYTNEMFIEDLISKFKEVENGVKGVFLNDLYIFEESLQ